MSLRNQLISRDYFSFVAGSSMSDERRLTCSLPGWAICDRTDTAIVTMSTPSTSGVTRVIGWRRQLRLHTKYVCVVRVARDPRAASTATWMIDVASAIGGHGPPDHAESRKRLPGPGDDRSPADEHGATATRPPYASTSASRPVFRIGRGAIAVSSPTGPIGAAGRGRIARAGPRTVRA